jgi:hypothetical protein
MDTINYHYVMNTFANLSGNLSMYEGTTLTDYLVWTATGGTWTDYSTDPETVTTWTNN